MGRRREAGVDQVDPVTLAVVSGALDAIVREMTITMRRAAMSPILAIGNDFSNCIADGSARVIIQGQDQPVHLGAMIFCTGQVADYFGDDLAPGDAIYHNDPRTGGSHLQDMTLYKPIFYEDELLFWAVNRSHMNETGGPVAGGYNPLAEEIWAEGLRISPVKLYEAGEPRYDVIDLLMTNFRISKQMRGDLGAQVAACGQAEQRLTALTAKYGVETIKRCQSQIIDRAQKLMRAEISRMPDGEYHGHGMVEDNGRGSGDLEIACTLRIDGDEMYVGLDAPPMVNSYINSYPFNSTSGVYLAVLSFVDPTMPHNEGTYRPIHVDLGEAGSIVHAVEPGACSATTTTPLENITDAVRAALSQAVPEWAGGGWAHVHGNSLFGIDPRHHEPYTYFAHMSHWGGGGAFWGQDGEHVVGTLAAAGGAMTGNIEVVEYQVPIHIHRYELDPESACPGRWRGGLGAAYEFTVVDHDATMTQLGDGMKYPAPSTLGAESRFNGARVYQNCVARNADGALAALDGSEPLDQHGICTVHAGEKVLIQTPGGGGVAPTYEREVAAVAADVRNGFVSPDRARAEYAVAIDVNTFAIDEDETSALRSSAMEAAV